MKKVVSKLMIALICVVGVIAVTALVLGLIPYRPEKAFEGYSRVEIYNLSSSDRIELEKNSAAAETFNKGLDSVSYSVLRAILEGEAGKNMKFKTVENADKKAEKERVVVKADEIGAVAASATLYKLVFVYPETRSVVVEDETVEFDRAVLLVGDSENEIRTMEAYFYLDSRIGNQATDESLSSEYYEINPVIVRARTTKLFNAVADTIKTLRP